MCDHEETVDNAQMRNILLKGETAFFHHVNVIKDKRKIVRFKIKREQWDMATQCKIWSLTDSFVWRNFSSYIGLYSETAMAPHSSTPAWKIPWTEEPGRLQSMESLRVGHEWATSLSLFTFRHWRRKWQPTPVFLPGESQGQGSLVGCRLWGRTESETTKET